jgi:hypothetical protein
VGGPDLRWAQIVFFILSLFEVAIIALAGYLRRRLGWASVTGQFLWLMLIFSSGGGIWLWQKVLYWEMTSRNPFDDIIASITIIGAGVIGIGIVFYYAIKYSK